MGLRGPEFLDTLQTITGQDPKDSGPLAVRLHFGNADPVNYVHILAEEQELEDLLKGMRDGPDSDVLSGGRQRRGGRREGGYLDVLANGRGDFMDNVLLQQTMDMMDHIIELGRQIAELSAQIEAFDNEHLTEEERAEMAGMTEPEKDAYRLARAEEKVRRGEISQEDYNQLANAIRERQEKREELAEFVDEFVDQLRQTDRQYRELVQKRAEINTQLTANEALQNRLGELRDEGENDETRAELDGIIRTRTDLDIRLRGNETYHQRIDAVEGAVMQQTSDLIEDLGEVATAIETIEAADEVVTTQLPGQQLLEVEAKGAVVDVEADAGLYAAAGMSGEFKVAHAGDVATVDAVQEVKPAEEIKIVPPAPIEFS